MIWCEIMWKHFTKFTSPLIEPKAVAVNWRDIQFQVLIMFFKYFSVQAMNDCYQNYITHWDKKGNQESEILLSRFFYLLQMFRMYVRQKWNIVVKRCATRMEDVPEHLEQINERFSFFLFYIRHYFIRS